MGRLNDLHFIKKKIRVTALCCTYSKYITYSALLTIKVSSVNRWILIFIRTLLAGVEHFQLNTIFFPLHNIFKSYVALAAAKDVYIEIFNNG
jgi:hypothetical protein